MFIITVIINSNRSMNHVFIDLWSCLFLISSQELLTSSFQSPGMISSICWTSSLVAFIVAWADSLNECTDNCEVVTWNWCLLALLLSMFCLSWLLLHDLDDLLEILGCHLWLPLNCCCKCSRVFWLSQLLSSLWVLWLNLKVDLLHNCFGNCATGFQSVEHRQLQSNLDPGRASPWDTCHHDQTLCGIFFLELVHGQSQAPPLVHIHLAGILQLIPLMIPFPGHIQYQQ